MPVLPRIATLGLSDLSDPSVELIEGGAPGVVALAASLEMLGELHLGDLPRVLVYRPDQAQQAIEALNTGLADLAVPWGQAMAPALAKARPPRLEERAARHLLDQVQGLANLGYWTWRIQADEVIWSDQLYRIYGLDQASFGASFAGYMERVHPEDRERVQQVIRATLETCGNSTFEERIQRPDGELRHLRSWASVDTDPEGRPVAMHGCCMDITERVWARRSLEASEKRYRRIFDSLGEGYLMTSADSGVILRANPAAAQLLGVDGPLVGLSMADFWLSAEDRAAMQSELQANKGELRNAYLRLRRANGELLLAEVNLRAHSGVLEGTFRDVTTRVEEEQLHRRRYGAAFHQSPLHLQILSPEGHILDVNQRMLDEREVEASELMGKLFWQLPYVQSIPGLAERLQWVVQRVATGESRRSEVSLPTDAGVLVLLSHMTPILAPDGQVEGILVASMDLTDNRKAHQELERQSREFAAGYAISRGLVAAAQPQAVLEAILKHLPPCLDGRQVALELDGQRKGPDFEPSRVLRGQDSAHAFSVLLDGPPLRQSQHQLVTDVVRRVDQWLRHYDARVGLAHALEASQAAGQARGSFLAQVSHEIRTPLHALLGFANLLQTETTLDELQTESVTQIRDNGRRLLDMLENVLTMSRLETGLPPQQLEEVDLLELLGEVVTLFSPRARERDLQLRLESELAEAPARVDTRKLRQIVTNLLANALRHTRQGQVVVRVESNGQRHRVMVVDTGPGIAPSERERIFEPFQRGEGGATGLGLAISRQLATSMGGMLLLHDTGPGGSTFRLELPRQVHEPGPSSEELPSSPRLRVPAELVHPLLRAARQGDIDALERLCAALPEQAAREELQRLLASYELHTLIARVEAQEPG